jgi:hypothetical protein
MSSNEENVKIRLFEARKNYLKQGNSEPTQVRFSWFTACDFCKIAAELGKLGETLIQKGPDALNGEVIWDLHVTIDRKLLEHAVPEFHFS